MVSYGQNVAVQQQGYVLWLWNGQSMVLNVENHKLTDNLNEFTLVIIILHFKLNHLNQMQ